MSTTDSEPILDESSDVPSNKREPATEALALIDVVPEGVSDGLIVGDWVVDPVVLAEVTCDGVDDTLDVRESDKLGICELLSDIVCVSDGVGDVVGVNVRVGVEERVVR